MKKASVGLVAAALAAFGFAGNAEAQLLGGQLPLSVEIRGGLAVPTGDLGDQAENGVGFGATTSYQVTPMIAVYGGYSRYEFDQDEEFVGIPLVGIIDDDLEDDEDKLVDDGFEAGGKFFFGQGMGLAPYAFAGALFHEETGFEAGAGINYALGPTISFTPSARYRSIDDASYATVDAALTFRF